MSSENSNPFTAGASATGYLYQCRYALLLLLERCKDDPDAAVSIEKFDDISFDGDGSPRELIQSKHHLGKAPELSDTSADLWKSLRVWSEGIANKRFAVPQATLALVTTAQCAADSAVSLLRKEDGRNATEAHRRLVETAHRMTGETLEKARKSFLDLPNPDRLGLIKALYVMDRSPSITDAADEIRRSVGFPVRQDLLGAFLERLEGWWFGEAILRLSGKTSDPITGAALWFKIHDISSRFLQSKS